MKTKIVALALFICTATVVALFPATRNVGAITALPVPPVDPPANAPVRIEVPRIEVVFVLDTTGSMGGLIQAAKEKVWSIATTMAQAEPAPEIKMGLVAYRDRGDAYVSRVVDLSADLDSMYATLMDFEANGGGDGPESVNQALYEAVHNVSWSQDPAPGIGAKERLSMSAKIKYTDEPLGETEVVADFLPSPAELAFREEGVKVTLALGKKYRVLQVRGC